MEPVIFDSVAGQGNWSYKYASLGSVIELAKDMTRYGLSFTQLPVSDGWNVGVETMLMHESGQWIRQEFYIPIDTEAKNLGQEAGKAITYSRRYALSALLGIYADEDTDNSKQVVTNQLEETKKPSRSDEKRPYSPQELKRLLAEVAEKERPATDKQRKLFVVLLSKETGDKRHTIQEYLFGETSSKDIDAQMINAALKWMKPTPDSGGDLMMCDMAKKELSAVHDAALIAKGQQKMDEVLKSVS
jgi:hypothetical protein